MFATRTLLRLAKIVMCAAIACYAMLVVFGNVTDYQSNFEFVKHVLMMDTTFPDSKLHYRAISSEGIWELAYASIILAEFLTGLLFCWGCWRMAAALQADPKTFNRAKTPIILGVTLGFMTWYFGFMVVGGEWFAMWQSKFWNGQEAAFRTYTTLVLVLIFVMQPEPEW